MSASQPPSTGCLAHYPLIKSLPRHFLAFSPNLATCYALQHESTGTLGSALA